MIPSKQRRVLLLIKALLLGLRYTDEHGYTYVLTEDYRLASVATTDSGQERYLYVFQDSLQYLSLMADAMTEEDCISLAANIILNEGDD